MQKRLKEILHKYKVDAFKFAHGHENLDEVTKEVLTFREDTLTNAYHYHFHKLPDANRMEIINMINNYTLEAILPPVVEKLLRRIVVLEHQQKAMVEMLTEVLEVLSGDAGE